MSIARLRRGRPLWLSSADGRPKRRYPSLKGHREADVVVVGGGITGALAALAFAEAGVSVVLLEGALIGRGSTSASSALLLQEPDQGMAELTRLYGSRACRRIWRLSHDAVRDFISTLRRLRIACDLVKRDAVYCAANREAAARLRAEFALREQAGFGGEWMTAGAIRRTTGLASPGAIRTTGNAQFNPYKASLGLTAAASVSGAAIFERSPVTRIVPRPDGVHVRTRQGTVAAQRVVIATGYATKQFRPLAGRFRMYRTYVLMTERLSQRHRREIGVGQVMLWDTERPYHYARWTSDGRLLLGGGDRPMRTGARRDRQFADATRKLREDFEARLPGLSDVRVDGAWEGLFAMTPDSLPYVGAHRRYPKHLFALGYGGNGMTFGFLAARLLVELWEGIQSSDHQLFGFDRLR